MIYSKTCEYAVRSLSHLAQQGEGVYLSAVEISDSTGVPGPYISKIFQALVKQGILRSRRGAAGGVTLNRNPAELTLMQIIDAIDDLEPLNECAMGFDQCEDDNGCPLHDVWKKAKDEIILKFKNTKLAEVTKASNHSHYRTVSRSRLKIAAA